jgi:hypothetical protein
VSALAGPASAQTAPSPSGAARILGVVVNPEVQASIAGAVVELRPGGRTATADAQGRFVFDKVASGTYHLVATLPGFSPSAPLEVAVAGGGDVVVRVEYPLRMVTEVDVPAPPLPEPTVPSGVARTTLDARAIALAPGALEDVYRAFQTAPGATASQDDRNDVLVRGGGAIETATRVDGFDVPNPSHFGAQGGSGGGLSAISPWVIDRATLQPGGFSVQFGERASSVIDITLKNGNRDRFAGQAGAGVGGAMALAEGPLAGRRGGWLVSVRRSFLELVLSRGTDSAVPQYADAVAKVDLVLADHHQLEVLALAGSDDVEAKSGGSRDVLRDQQQIGLVGVSLRSQWGEATSTGLFASFGINQIHATTYDWANKPDAWDRSHERELRVRGEVRRRLGSRSELMGGVAIKRGFLSFDLLNTAWRNAWGNVVPSLHVDRSDQVTEAGAYGELTSRLVSSLRVTAGVRADHPATGSVVVVSPRGKVEYGLSPRVRFTGSWGIFRQDIPYIWIGSDPGNRNLEPIASRQGTVGVELRAWRGMQAIVEAFDKRYRNYPVDPVAPAHVLISAAADFEVPFVTALSSGGRVHARGIDTCIAQRLGSQVDVSVTYSWWRVTQTGLDGVWRPADYDIRHQARLAATWRPGRHWSVGADWRYADGRPYTPIDVKASIKAGSGRYDLTRVNAVRYPPYHRLDLRGDCRLGIGRHAAFVFYAELENVYDRHNPYFYQWNSNTKTIDTSYQWGRQPIAGVRIEF